MFEIIRFWDCTICQDNLKAVLPEDQVARCQSFIEVLLPPALQILFTYLEENTETACHVLYSVC